MKKYITIITPTYNRGNRLKILLNSLNKQINKNFVWILVDDGSTDSTQEIVEKWKIKDFPFHYIRQSNGGKHRAINNAMAFVETEFVFIVDSDDYLLEDAISNIESWIKTIQDEPDIAAVSGLKIYPNGKRVSGFPKKIKTNNYVIASNLERWKRGLIGDQAEIYKTELLQKYPFPEFEEEKFISESAVWNRIAIEGYKVKWYNTPIYVCEYLEDGLTKNIDDIVLRNFNGFTYTQKLSANYLRGWYRIKSIVKYIKISKRKGLTLKEIAKELDINILYIFLGYILLYLYNFFRLEK